MTLTKKIKEKIKKHALEEAPRECCGLIMLHDNQVDAYPCKNMSSLPEIHFKISPSDYIKYSSVGKIEAIYHSHPKGTEGFSLADKQNYNATKERFILYSLENDKFEDSHTQKNEEFLGLEFKPGVSDCMALAEKYFSKKFNHPVTYSEIWPDENYYKKDDGSLNFKKIISKFKSFGFDLVKPTPSTAELLKEHDVLVTLNNDEGFFGLKCHLAIYTGNDSALYQPVTKTSRLVSFTGYLSKNTIMVFRPNFI